MIKVFAGFFGFGTAMCILTMMLLLFPGTPFDSVWRLNPDARAGFQLIGPAAIALMFVVGTGCRLRCRRGRALAEQALGRKRRDRRSFGEPYWRSVQYRLAPGLSNFDRAADCRRDDLLLGSSRPCR
jgi:hypothetical protein